MKKNLSGAFFSRKHLIRVMKIYSLLLCIAISKLFSFSTYSQNISISLNEVTLQVALKEIEQRSEYGFFYNNSLVDISKEVSLTAQNEKIEKVLHALFYRTNIDFKIFKNQIVLFPRNKRAPNSALKRLLKKMRDSSLEQPMKNVKTISIIQHTVSGTVTDFEGLALPGANVIIKGTSKGTLTDFDGKYALEADIGDVLVFSYLGYRAQEVVVRDNAALNVVLQENVSTLEEVILTGYSAQRKSRITGAAVSVKPEILTATPRAVLQESLQGNVAGLQVVASTGQPGSNPNVRIRGVGSFADADPLYVLDGLQVSPSVLATINPGDVTNISVLKDAAATSIYGTRGANGVVVITTKKGVAGKTRVNYSTQTGFSTPTVASRFRPLSASEQQELLIEGAINAGRVTNETDGLQFIIDNAGWNPGVDVDWYDEIIRTGIYTQQDLSISGGSEKTQFYLSGGYFNQQGVIAASDFERFNTRLRVNHQINDRISFDANLSYNKDIRNNRPSEGNDENPIRALYRIRSDQAAFNPDGTFNLSFNDEHNPLALAEAETRRDIRHRVLAGFSTEIKITDQLSAVGLITTNTTFLDSFVRLPAAFSDSADLDGFGRQDTDILFDQTLRAMLKYDVTFGGNHNITAFGGYEVFTERDKRTTIEAQNIPDAFVDLNNASQQIRTDTERREAGVSSLFMNAEYSFDDKYLISGSFRRDGSSRFPEKNQIGNFWSVGFGWNIAREDFMKNQKIFNDFKFRGSYGINGSDAAIGDNQFSSTFGTVEYNDEVGIIFNRIGNPGLRWEENATLDLGIDFSMFNSRIRGNFDWYTRTTKNLLSDVPISPINGDTDLSLNIGEMQNRGFEIELSIRNIVSNSNGFTWSTSLNISHNKNEVTQLANNNADIVANTSIRRVGEDFNTFFLPVYAGVDPANGQALWYTTGTRTVVTSNYNEADQAIVGDPTPDFYGGIRNTFTYGAFSLGFQFYTSWGGSLYDTWGRFTNSDGSRASSTIGNVNRGTYERRWQNPGDVTDVPAFIFGNTQTGASSQRSSRFMYDGSYVRLREAEIAYTFPLKHIEKLNLSRLKVYIKGNNLWTFIKDDRLERDPEAGLTGRLDQEIPITKTVFLGLDVSF